MVLNPQKAHSALRTLLGTHVGERRSFDNIHEYLTPWNSATAAARIGVRWGGGR